MNTRPLICGIGFHVPEKILTNAELEAMVDTTDEWITTRTGIRERRIAAPGEACSDLGAAAARQALADAGLTPEEVTHILVATFTPDCYVPASAYILQEKLGLRGRTAMDFSAACTGFITGLELCRAFLALHPEAVILLVASEAISSRVNYADRGTCVLFGDGAGAIVVRGQGAPVNSRLHQGAAIADVKLSSDGSLWELLTIRGGGSSAPIKLGEPVGENFFVQMQGREVFKHAVRSMEAVCREVMERNGLTMADIDLLIPHQANNRIIEAVGKKLEAPEDKVFVNVDRYGNTSAASVAIALAEAVQAGRIRAGHKVLLTAFGGGFTWGAALLQF